MKWLTAPAIACMALTTLVATPSAAQAVQAAPANIQEQDSNPAADTAPQAPQDYSNGYHGVVWPNFYNSPHKFSKMTFPMTIKSSPDTRQFFFSNQFYYAHASDAGYFGLQPMERAADGHRQVSVRFSSFNKNATPVDTGLCHSGADGRGGVTCATDIPFTPGAKYDLSMTFTKEDHTFHGKVIDTASHKEYNAGSYKIPEETEGITTNNLMSWHEDYTKHPEKGKCNSKDFPYYDVTLGRPQGTTEAGLTQTATFNNLSLKFQDICPNADHSSINSDGTATWRLGFK